MSRRAIVILVGVVLIATFALVLILGALLVFSASSADTRQSFVSPSGQSTIHLIETCHENVCSHQAVVSFTTSTGSAAEIRCGLEISTDQPVFSQLALDWWPDESGVFLRYGSPVVSAPGYPLDFTVDCNS